MLDWLLDPFAGGIARRALLELVAAGAAAGPLGVWVLLNRRGYAAESMSHGMLPGLVAAALAGVPLVLGAAGGVLLAAAGIALASRDERLGGDTGVAVAVTGLFGLGALLALAGETPPRLLDLLFGDPLGVTSGDVAATSAIAAALVAALAAAHRPLVLATFDRPAAPSLGGRPGRSDLLLLVLLGGTTVAVVQALGNLLVLALVLAPAATALRLTSRLVPALVLAAALAALAGALGLLASHHADVAAGASVALAAIALLALSFALPGGSLSPWLRDPARARRS